MVTSVAAAWETTREFAEGLQLEVHPDKTVQFGASGDLRQALGEEEPGVSVRSGFRDLGVLQALGPRGSAAAGAGRVLAAWGRFRRLAALPLPYPARVRAAAAAGVAAATWGAAVGPPPVRLLSQLRTAAGRAVWRGGRFGAVELRLLLGAPCGRADPAAVADGSFPPLREADWVRPLHAHAVGGDDDADLLFSDRKGARAGLFWLENPGAAANQDRQPWREHALGALGREVMFADLADIDGDGRPEVLAAVKPRDIVILRAESGGRWREEILSLPPEGLGDAKAVRAADLNGDGRVDLVFSCEHARGELEGVVWLERRADGGWWQRSLAGAPGVKFDLVQVPDRDGDGELEAATRQEAEGLGGIG